MSYFYVKNSLGTRTTGGGLTQQTGSFTTLGAASVYAKIEDAITDGAGAGDFIMCSDAHDYDSSSTAITYSLSSATASAVYIISVADANCDQYSAGATERITGGVSDMTFNGNSVAWGMTFRTNDWLIFGTSNTANIFYYSILQSPNDVTSCTADGKCIVCIDTTMEWGDTAGSRIQLSGGSTLIMHGGKIYNPTPGTPPYITQQGFQSGGGHIYLYGVDLSGIDTTLIADAGAGSADNGIEIFIDRCQLNASVAFSNENFYLPNQRMLITRSSSSSAAAEYQYHFKAPHGTVDDDTSFYRDGSTAFPDSSQKISLKCQTLSTASREMPFVFDYPLIYAPLSSTATDVLTLYILCSATLTDADVSAELLYPDGTNKNVSNRVESVTDAFDPLRTGSTLSTNTESWTGRTTENRYQVQLDTSGDAGADTVPSVLRVSVTKASTTIYFCPTLGLS